MTYESRPEDKKIVPAVYDEVIRTKLNNLPLDALKELSELSGTTMNSGYLMSNPDEDNREVYIEELSDISDKAQWQIDKIYDALKIDK
jgi:hypothetical protein